MWRRVASVGPKTVSRMKSLGHYSSWCGCEGSSGPQDLQQREELESLESYPGPGALCEDCEQLCGVAFVSLSKQSETLLRS